MGLEEWERRTQAEGTVLVNGEEVSDREMRAMSAYVQQVDVFCGTLTVREQLRFSAALRMPRGTATSERREAVENALKDVRGKRAGKG